MGYRGELIGKFKLTTDSIPTVYQEGERVMQLVVMPYPSFEPVFVDELEEGDRGDKGYGSSNEVTEDPSTEAKQEYVGEVTTDDTIIEELETINA